MQFLWQGLWDALKMIISLDQELVRICLVSIQVSTIAIILATLVGLPMGFIVGTREFFGKRVVATVLNTLLALPTVIVGLFVYSLISRSAFLGPFGLLYTPTAMVIGQFILATPIIAALTMVAMEGIDPRVEVTARTLGATAWQANWTMLAENRYAIMAAIIAGFGRIFAEVGVSMMLGGNIKGYTRNITTAITFETGKGEFVLGFALGIILLAVALCINIIFHWFQGRKT